MSQRVLKPLRPDVSVISPGYEQGDDIFCCASRIKETRRLQFEGLFHFSDSQNSHSGATLSSLQPTKIKPFKHSSMQHLNKLAPLILNSEILHTDL